VLYRFADLVLDADIELPELPELRSGSAECSVWSELPTCNESQDDRWDHHWRGPDGSVTLSCAREAQGYRLGVPGLATFLIGGDGATIAVRPLAGVSPRTLEHLLIDQVLPRVLALRGRTVIHAGCVATPVGAIAFLGDSGAGKSTLCAELARAGYPLLGDDGIVVSQGARGFEAIATYPGLRLLPDPLTALFDDPPGAEAVADYTAKRRLRCNGVGVTLAAGPEPLRGLYWLAPGPRIVIDELDQRAGFLALIRSSFQLHLDDPERSGRLFDRVGALSQALPVRRLTYPRELGLLPAVRDALVADAALYLAPACASAS
jgi:hypothetical protein